MLPEHYLESRDYIQELHTQLIGRGEREVLLLSTLLERAQNNLTYHKNIMRLMTRHDAGMLTPEETANMFALMRAQVEQAEKETASKVDTTTKRPDTSSSPTKRSRKRGLKDEVLKPTDDLT